MRVYSDSVLCVGQMDENKEAIVMESMEKQLTSSGIFPRIFVIADASRNFTRFEKKKHRT